jgi:transcriptional regulator NrdR family protein
MNNQSIIRKASGETEPFSEEKLQASLRRTGANDETIAAVVNDVKKGIVLCRQLLQHPEELDQLGLTHSKRKKLMEELEALNSKQ